MKRILFVDDEARILDGLKRMLRGQRKEWEMVFALGGPEALRLAADHPFDVIVTDMRMPEMDGAQLLQAVHEIHPQTVRIVLSGYTELEAVMRAVPLAHRFMTKPCNAEQLKEVVSRSCTTQALLADSQIADAIGELDTLPSLPSVYRDLTRKLADPEAEISAIAAIVTQDPAMCAKVLQLVNSSFFGLPQNLSGIDQAVGYLGTNMLRNLVLSVEVFRPAPDSNEQSRLLLSQLQRHSTRVASVAKLLVDSKSGSDDAFMAGMLHDLGVLVLSAQLPDRYSESLHLSEASNLPLHVAEEEIFGVSHAEVGAYLLGLWGLPYPIIEAVAFHHHPCRVEQTTPSALTAVHVADALLEQASPCGHLGRGPSPKLDLNYLENLGVSDQLPEWEDCVASYLSGNQEDDEH